MAYNSHKVDTSGKERPRVFEVEYDFLNSCVLLTDTRNDEILQYLHSQYMVLEAHVLVIVDYPA